MGGSRPPPNKDNFLLFLKSVSCFLETIFTGGFITPTASENRFSLAVLSYAPVKMMIFYWPLALAVTKNATINRFTTATIELLCTSDL
jgi:hypothetical protein